MMSNTPTPHIGAVNGDFAETVLMPGDPLRAKYIAENFLTEARLVTSVRNMLGYTGLYQGQRLSVMSSGMGAPSMGIYAYELYNFYGVKNIIRIGTIGAIDEHLHIGDVILALSSCTNTNFAAQYRLPGTATPTASFPLIYAAYNTANRLNLPVHVGTVFSSDTFYDDAASLADWKKIGVLGVEMESAALYLTAARANKNALCICTVSDCPFTGEATTAEQRQTAFRDMMKLALETAVNLSPSVNG